MIASTTSTYSIDKSNNILSISFPVSSSSLLSVLKYFRLSSCVSTFPYSLPSRPPPKSQPPHPHRRPNPHGTARARKQGKYLNPRSQFLTLTLYSYKVGAVVCGVGAFICNAQGYTVGQYTLGTGAFCCSSAAAAVTVSQSQGWADAWRAAAEGLGAAAQVVSGAYAKVGQFVAQCSATVCTMIQGTNPVTGLPTRTIDGPALVEKDLTEEVLVARSAQPEAEFGENVALLSRYADSEPEAE